MQHSHFPRDDLIVIPFAVVSFTYILPLFYCRFTIPQHHYHWTMHNIALVLQQAEHLKSIPRFVNRLTAHRVNNLSNFSKSIFS